MSNIRYRSNEGELIPIIVIIIVNFLVYIGVNIANFSNINILPYLALSSSTFLQVPWTVFSYMFTHVAFFHILANMVTFYFYGSFLNRITGTKTFLAIYLIGGLVAGVFIILLASPLSLTIGASGAVFALGGALAVLVPKLKVFIFPIPVPMPLWVAILIGFVILAIIPHVSWQGHLGGLLTGLAAGWIMRKRMRVIY
ncbi:MAG: rhomboid family intramembrane serine protease [Dehalococcoidia bacterium]|nr:rhomboid family intramembrane serine protease [Dehalococcoidia bacterium]